MNLTREEVKAIRVRLHRIDNPTSEQSLCASYDWLHNNAQYFARALLAALDDLDAVKAERDAFRLEIDRLQTKAMGAVDAARAAEAANAALTVRNEALLGALENVAHMGHDCPATFAGDEADWQAVRGRLMQQYARAALIAAAQDAKL